MFNFKDIKESNPIGTSKRREGCALVDVTKNKEDGSVTFQFIEKITNATLNHREFVPNRLEQMTDEEYKKNVTLNVSRIAHIYRAFATDEQFQAVAVEDPNNPLKYKENWLAVTGMVGKSLKQMIADKKDMTCALKITLRKQVKEGKTNFYSSLPQVPPFISTTNHPKDFIYNPQYDLLEIPTISPDREGPATQGAANTTATNGSAASQPSAFAGQASGNGDF